MEHLSIPHSIRQTRLKVLYPFKLRSSKSEEVVLFTNKTIFYTNIVYLPKMQKL